jgi:hypothetical protein
VLRSIWFPATVVLIVALWAYTRFEPSSEPVMPAGVDGEEARRLYLIPGGKYTEADIAMNGRTTSAEKYRGFRSSHAVSRTGDRVCPVTGTRADPRCVWIIGGREYQFCCPPCIDEFVRLAKEEPERVREPGDYLRR